MNPEKTLGKRKKFKFELSQTPFEKKIKKNESEESPKNVISRSSPQKKKIENTIKRDSQLSLAPQNQEKPLNDPQVITSKPGKSALKCEFNPIKKSVTFSDGTLQISDKALIKSILQNLRNVNRYNIAHSHEALIEIDLIKSLIEEKFFDNAKIKNKLLAKCLVQQIMYESKENWDKLHEETECYDPTKDKFNFYAM